MLQSLLNVRNALDLWVNLPHDPSGCTSIPIFPWSDNSMLSEPSRRSFVSSRSLQQFHTYCSFNVWMQLATAPHRIYAPGKELLDVSRFQLEVMHTSAPRATIMLRCLVGKRHAAFRFTRSTAWIPVFFATSCPLIRCP